MRKSIVLILKILSGAWLFSWICVIIIVLITYLKKKVQIRFLRFISFHFRRNAIVKKKYEFVEGDEKVTPAGIIVKRIRALVAVQDTSVVPGDLGGYIQQESNLDHRGAAWVYDNAQVYGNARVRGDALVYGNARVSDAALVAGDALVYGNGLIFWASKVGTQNGTLTVYNTKDNGLFVTRGCFLGTPAEFLARSAKQHDERTHREYSLLIEVATSRIETARAKFA